MTYKFDSSINEIGNLASGIFLYDFDEDSGVIRPEYISGWLQNNLGEINILTHSCFQGENPGLNEEEQAIYRQIFLKSFYGKIARKTLMGLSTVQTTYESGGSGTSEMSDWIELREGDSYIKRQVTTASPSTKVSASKQYSSYAQEAELTLKDLIVGALALLGILGSINWIEIPFWVYLLLIVVYAGLRLAKKEDNTINDINAKETGGELPPDDDEEGGAV